ncbi:oxidoreductase [uncultured Parasphingopyxis sp.]|uniref:oxidoreductase n=1 Tax=uncultured Parasphingopyxis sp. TaxID=1547918 RepID=UPI002621A640|nr:oxidoreductase [uncultured Parasphingopyxis sp.]
MAIKDQVPVDSGFPAKTDGANIIADIDLAGKTAIVTGGYSGIGLETVRALAAKGVQVIIPARNIPKAKEALADVEGDVRIEEMDLADIPSVRAFGDKMLEELESLDLLINNAGVMACPEEHIGAGWELQFGTNHLGHFELTRKLMPLLEKTPGCRVIALSSTGHKLSGIRWDDPNFEMEPYEKWQAYGQAKSANALFANALSRRLKDSGGLAFAVHPGGIFTPLQRHLPQEEMIALGWLDENGELSEMAKAGFKTPEQGCSTTLWAAISPKLEGKPGVYCEDCDIAEPTDPEGPMARYRGADPHICEDEAAERLWAMSEEMIGEA